LARLVDLAVEAAGESEVDVAVHHLDGAQRAGAAPRGPVPAGPDVVPASDGGSTDSGRDL
ncbi:hypothetical protein AB0J06_22750, partial [Micromonospora sp. NPDC049679]